MDNGQWTMDNGQWTMDNGQWTMDRDYVAPFRANPNIADPTDLLDPADPTDRSEKPIGQITNSRAIPSVEAATLQIFRVFRAFRGQKMGCGRQPTPSPLVSLVVKKTVTQLLTHYVQMTESQVQKSERYFFFI
jgi:hypothetical protein